eukprot:Tbor_TRINITY_DN2550_c0_g1::TRINITY_DN2550_c0_g1_i1::g.455::m.455/K14396/PABPN1, PABP2; polyadenylate-binding protein 2
MDSLYDEELPSDNTPSIVPTATDTTIDTFVLDEGYDEEFAALEKQVSTFEEDRAVRQMQENASKEDGARRIPVQAPHAHAVTGTQPTSAPAATSSSVFVGNVDPSATEEDLQLFFASCGTINRVTILRDKTTKHSKGLAYVEFAQISGCSAALSQNNAVFRGKPIKVALKRDNIPAFQRGVAGGRGGFTRGRGSSGGLYRGGSGAMQQMNPMMQMAAAMMAMSQQPMGGFNPMYGQSPPRGRGRGGRGRGRGG